MVDQVWTFVDPMPTTVIGNDPEAKSRLVVGLGVKGKMFHVLIPTFPQFHVGCDTPRRLGRIVQWLALVPLAGPGLEPLIDSVAGH